MNCSAILVALAASMNAQAPVLKFSPGETLRYQSTISGSTTVSVGGTTSAININGSHVINYKVSSVAGGKATITVSYSGARATATATALPPEAKKDKAKIEKAMAERMKASMTGGERSQTVTPRGNSVYRISLGDGKTITIEDGAFMMLVLPAAFPAVNGNWKAGIRMPDPMTSGLLNVTYKNMGLVNLGKEQAYKIGFSSYTSDSKNENGVNGKRSARVNGSLFLGATSGKLLKGEIRRNISTTITAKQGTRTSVEDFVQTFTKI